MRSHQHSLNIINRKRIRYLLYFMREYDSIEPYPFSQSLALGAWHHPIHAPICVGRDPDEDKTVDLKESESYVPVGCVEGLSISV